MLIPKDNDKTFSSDIKPTECFFNKISNRPNMSKKQQYITKQLRKFKFLVAYCAYPGNNRIFHHFISDLCFL